MPQVELLHDYRLRVQKTCCYSGIVSSWSQWPWHARTEFAKGTIFDAFTVRPSVRIAPNGRTRFTCPQFVNIELNDGLHPTVLIEVPRDILKITESVCTAPKIRHSGMSS